MSHETRGRFRPHKNDLYLHAAINEAAKLSGAPPGAWIHSRLRACLDIELAQCDSAASKSRRANLLRWAAGQAPLDVTNLRSAKDICDSLSSGVVAQNPTAPRNLDARHQLYDPLAIEAVAARVTEKEHRVHFDALIRSQATRERPVLSRTQENNVRRLAIDAPHLAEATQTVLDAIAIARRAKGPPRLAPILLSGPPASGKSWWARQVAQALGFPATTIVMPKVTASFVLSGSTASWSSARPGRIVEAFIGTRIASPVIIIDEIEKASAARYDPTPVLLDLLDHASASRWHDEFFGVEFDVSSAIFVATCNSPELLDPALRSRFREIRVRTPDAGSLQAVIQSAWRSHRDLYFGLQLPVALPEPAIRHLARTQPDMRMLQRCFDDAIARAVRRPGRIRIIPADLGAPAVELA